jgi:hypothetical protein
VAEDLHDGDDQGQLNFDGVLVAISLIDAPHKIIKQVKNSGGARLDLFPTEVLPALVKDHVGVLGRC